MMKKIKRDTLLIVTVVLLAFVVGLVVILFPKSVNKEEQKTAKVLQAMENKDIEEVNEKVKENQKKLMLNNDSGPIKEHFQNAVIVGDSIAEGLLDYDILDKSQVFCKRGLRIDNCDDYLDQALLSKPDYIFLEFGVNDIKIWQEEVDKYIEGFKEKIEYIKKKDKNIKIFINEVLPVSAYARRLIPAYDYIDRYNDELIDLCKELDITFIKCSFILDTMENIYERDGVHPKPGFYEKWAQTMKIEAGL